MTKFRLMSDTHMEFTRKNKVRFKSLADDQQTILILAGDIGTWKQATSWMMTIKEQFAQIVYVAGNHEFYGQEMRLALRHIKQRLLPYDNLHFLENSMLELDDCILIGATFWTDMNAHDPQTIDVCHKDMNDYHLIQLGSPEEKRTLHPNDTIKMHEASKKYFEQVIDNATKPIVIITHHAPKFGEASDEDIGAFDDRIQYAYVTDMDKWLSARSQKIALWCHGHTHKSMKYEVAGVPVYTNAKGYACQKTGFDECFSFELNGVVTENGI